MKARRLFRWLGSKQHLLSLVPQLRSQLGPHGRCVSLFYGSGALEQSSFPGAPVLAAEANADLVALLTQLGADPARLWRALLFADECSRRLRDGEGAYARMRALVPRTPLERAARFLWLSSLSRSGIWRVNRAGSFNVPPDRDRLRRAWPFPGKGVFHRAAVAVRGTRFVPDWRPALAAARAGDLVIADPPYEGGFVEYTAARFAEADQQELAAGLVEAASRGASVVAFNSPAAARWYPSPWLRTTVPRSGRINSRPDLRAPVDEFMAVLGCRSAVLVAGSTVPEFPEQWSALC